MGLLSGMSSKKTGPLSGLYPILRHDHTAILQRILSKNQNLGTKNRETQELGEKHNKNTRTWDLWVLISRFFSAPPRIVARSSPGGSSSHCCAGWGGPWELRLVSLVISIAGDFSFLRQDQTKVFLLRLRRGLFLYLFLIVFFYCRLFFKQA